MTALKRNPLYFMKADIKLFYAVYILKSGTLNYYSVYMFINPKGNTDI